MSFIWPVMLAALALIPLGIGIFLAIERRRTARAAALGGFGLRTREATRAGRLGQRIPPLLFLAAMIVLTVALARPQAVLSLPRAEGIVMLTFDVSGSMAADDLTPSRLDVAKDVARAMVDQRPAGVVIGVVAFSDAGLSVQTPTDDGVTLQQAIARLRPTLGTSVGEGIIASLGAIERVESGTPPEYYSNRSPAPTETPQPVEPGSHAAAAIVLLTDGDNTSPPQPIEAAQIAADRGIPIDTVGVGTIEGTTIESEDFSVFTQLDEPVLRSVAEMTAGTYFALDPEADPISATFDPSEVYDHLERQLNVRGESTEVTSLLAGAGILLLLLAAVTSLRLSGRLV